jgi:hypothetical protein
VKRAALSCTDCVWFLQGVDYLVCKQPLFRQHLKTVHEPPCAGASFVPIEWPSDAEIIRELEQERAQ